MGKGNDSDNVYFIRVSEKLKIESNLNVEIFGTTALGVPSFDF